MTGGPNADDAEDGDPVWGGRRAVEPETSGPDGGLAARLGVEGLSAGDLPFLLGCLAFAVVERLTAVRGRDDSLWVFGARGGDGFVCNAKYLYLHVAATHPGIRPVWLSKDRSTVRTLRDDGYEAYYAYSLRGMALELRAGAVLVTESVADVNLACAGGATIVQLWHGVPLKTIGWDAELAERPEVVQRGHAFLADRIDALVVTSTAVSAAFVSGLRIPEDRHVVAGYPRADVLVRDVPGAETGVDPDAVAAIDAASADGTVIAYLPTFRDRSTALDARLDFPALDAFLAARGAHLVVKTHPAERIDLRGEFSRIHQFPSGLDVYPLLDRVDVLVTDYSSVSVDFLLLDRPIVFYPFDREAYEDERGFYVAYEAVTPGPRASDFEELLSALEEVLASDDYATDRRALRDELFRHPAGTHAEHTYRAVRRLVDEQ